MGERKTFAHIKMKKEKVNKIIYKLSSDYSKTFRRVDHSEINTLVVREMEKCEHLVVSWL